MQHLLHWARHARPFPYEPRTAAAAMALLWLVGGVTTLLVAFLPHPPEMRQEVTLAIGTTSPVVALGILLLRDRLPTWAYPWLLATGTGVVTVLVAAGGGGSASVSMSFFYTWVVIYALLFFPPIAAALQIILAATGYATVLVAMGSFAAGTFTAVEPVVLAAVTGTSGAVVLLLAHARAVSELDPLTGIANRRGLTRLLDHAVDHPPADDEPLALAVIDMDHFKQINDTHGHQAGDRLLQDAVAQWRTMLRGDDTIVRFGGDEFVVVLRSCARHDAEAILQRLHNAAPDGVTCSIGVAELQPGDSPSMLITRADTALYQAKRLGRNQLVWADPNPTPIPIT